MRPGTGLFCVSPGGWQGMSRGIPNCFRRGVPAIIFCHGRTAGTDVSEAAAKENIAIFVSSGSQYETVCAFAKALGGSGTP
ncbi:MAG: hypothetical protein MUC65_02665 [Pontiellaceae bacterium]|jgi:hypothetical protein|nr:hypothetical protein [Pontiellaceae bacterium]